SISQLVFENPSMGAALEEKLTSGGVVGYLIVDPLATLVTPVPVWILSILIAFFSVLVITATPVGKIPSRLVGSYHWLTGQDSAASNANRAIDEAESEHPNTGHDQSYLHQHERQPEAATKQPGFFARLFGAKSTQKTDDEGQPLVGDEAFASAIIDDEEPVPAVELLGDVEEGQAPVS